MISGIYQIHCISNGKVYIGSSKDIYTRWKQHKSDLNRNRHPNPYMQKSYNKYGKIYFVYSILEECTEDKLLEREQYYLDYVFEANNTFNLALIAGSPTKGRKKPHTEETKKKISETKKGKNLSDEHKKALSDSHKGHKATESTKERMRISRANRKPITEETRQRMKDAAKGRKLTQETKNKMSKAHQARKAV